MADKYLLRVTAGPDYNLASHVEVPVNSPEPVHISSALIDADLNVRINNYRGLPRSAPHTSPYFEREPHKYNGDQYSIAFRFRLKEPAGTSEQTEPNPEQEQGNEHQNPEDHHHASENPNHQPSEQQSEHHQPPAENKDNTKDEATPFPGVAATDLQFGNDFDHPIRDRLPPGFGTAMNIVKWWIDPGLEGDPYADNPFLYGAALSSFNAVFVGEECGVGGGGTNLDGGRVAGGGGGGEGKGEGEGGGRGAEEEEGEGCGLWIEEGGNDKGLVWRRERGVPEEAGSRMKWALKAGSKEKWVWEYGREYGVDFFNPYIDFSEFALRLPGFNLPIMRYWDGQGLRAHRKRSHQLRYVLRNRSTGQVYLVVLFTLHLAEDVNEDGTLKPAALEAVAQASGGEGSGEQLVEPEPELEIEPDEEDFHEEEEVGEARRKLSGVQLNGKAETKGDDVD